MADIAYSQCMEKVKKYIDPYILALGFVAGFTLLAMTIGHSHHAPEHTHTDHDTMKEMSN